MLPDDVKRLAPVTLGHRVVPLDRHGGTGGTGGMGGGVGVGAAAVASIVATLPVPV